MTLLLSRISPATRLTALLLAALALSSCGGGAESDLSATATASRSTLPTGGAAAGDDAATAPAAEPGHAAMRESAAQADGVAAAAPELASTNDPADDLKRQMQALLPLSIGAPKPTCLVTLAQLQGLPPVSQWVEGDVCPSSPGPQCLNLLVAQISGNGQPWSYCAPAKDLLYMADNTWARCPLDYHEVTGDPDFSQLALTNGRSRLCQRLSATPPGAGRPDPACAFVNRRWVCPIPLAIPVGPGYNLATDREPPPLPSLDISGTAAFGLQSTVIFVDDNGPPGQIPFRLKASDPNGLGGVELLEFVGLRRQGESGQQEWQLVRRGQADPASFSAGNVTNYHGPLFHVPYSVSDPAERFFMVRAYDRAGNSSRSWALRKYLRHLSSIEIQSFKVTPTTLPPGGGQVTLSWSFWLASAASIDNGVGAVPATDTANYYSQGSRVVNVAANTTFTLTATRPDRLPKTASASVTVLADNGAPVVNLSASPTTVVAPGISILSANASDSVGVVKVEFYRGATLIGTDLTPPYQLPLNLTQADVGNASYSAKAYDAAGNVGTSNLINVSVVPDSTPPTVSLSASPATVVLPGSTTLTATASDASGISKVEFYRGNTLLATDTTAPYAHTVTFAAGDVGNVSFTAKAFDAQGNAATSAAALVAVSTPIIGDTYASPSGVDVGNTTCAQNTPCLTVGKAASLAGANKTVWLADGTYPRSANAVGGEISIIPAGLTIRAVTPGAVVLHRSLQLQGPATVVGVNMHGGTVTTYFTQIIASSGTVILEGVQFSGMTHPDNALLKLSGTAQVSLSPGALVDYTAALIPGYGSKFATIADSAHLTIQGGSIGSVNGTALGMAENGFALSRVPFVLTQSARLSLNSVALKVVHNGILMNGADTQVNFNGSTLTASSVGFNPVDGSGVYALRGAPAISLVNAAISGFSNAAQSAGLWVGPKSPAVGDPGASLTLSVTNAVLSGNGYGIRVTDGSTASLATVTATNLQVKNNVFGGLVCVAACNLNLSGGEVSGNGSQDVAVAGYYSFQGGLHLGSSVTHSLKLRNVSVINNASVSTSNTNSAENSGMTLGGNASSSFDLGTAASPGGNTFTGNISGNQTSGIHVKAAAGVVVQAVGNTFIANTQGANAQGKYVLGSSPCGASSCEVTSGGAVNYANYRVVSGTLRLAQ